MHRITTNFFNLVHHLTIQVTSNLVGYMISFRFTGFTVRSLIHFWKILRNFYRNGKSAFDCHTNNYEHHIRWNNEDISEKLQ